jgi:hypothetical protein
LPHTPNIYFEPIVKAPKVINYISAPKTRHASKKIKYKEKENTQPQKPKKEQKPKFVEKIKQVKEIDAEGKHWKE